MKCASICSCTKELLLSNSFAANKNVTSIRIAINILCTWDKNWLLNYKICNWCLDITEFAPNETISFKTMFYKNLSLNNLSLNYILYSTYHTIRLSKFDFPSNNLVLSRMPCSDNPNLCRKKKLRYTLIFKESNILLKR